MDLDKIEETLFAVVELNKAIWGVENIFEDAQARTMIKVGNPFVQSGVEIERGLQKSLGGVGERLWRRNGSMTFVTYVPVDKGSREHKRIQQKVLDTFEGRTFTGIVFGGSVSRPLGTLNSWTLKSLKLEFYLNITER